MPCFKHISVIFDSSILTPLLRRGIPGAMKGPYQPIKRTEVLGALGLTSLKQKAGLFPFLKHASHPWPRFRPGWRPVLSETWADSHCLKINK